MTKLIVDSYAWIEYFKASGKGLEVKNFIENGQNEIFIVSVIISEVISSIKRQDMDTLQAANVITSFANFIELTKEDLVNIGLLHAEMRKKLKDFGLGDSFILFSARKTGAKILTGDPHFKGMKEAIMI